MDTFNILPLRINLLYGEGFKNLNPCTAMQVYVKARINGGAKTTTATTTMQKTRKDKRNGTNPIWNSEMKFNLNHKLLLEQDSLSSNSNNNQTLELVFEVKSAPKIGVFGNKKLGEVRLPVKRLYQRVAAEEMVAGWTSMRCPVVGSSGRFKGALYFSYRFGFYEEVVVPYDRAAVVAASVASAPPLPPIGIYF